MENLSGFRQASQSTPPLKRLTTKYGGPESCPLVRGVNKSVVVHEIGKLDNRYERGVELFAQAHHNPRNNLRNRGSNGSDSTEPPTALTGLSQALSRSADMGISR
jgi:hypothetical protein